MKNSDLHIHSYYSDGHLSPKQLVKLAKKRGVKNLALTDHNTVRGVKEAIKEGKKIGVRVIPGVEFMAQGMIEILGYFIDINDRKLNYEMNRNKSSKKEKIKNFGRNFKIAGNKILFTENNFNFSSVYSFCLENYGKILNITKKARQHTIGIGVSGALPVIKAIKVIRNAGGVPVLAHPWVYDSVLEEKNIKKYVKAGLKGLEIDNGDSASKRKPKHIRKIKDLAKKYKLILTSGSDYHGLNLIKGLKDGHEVGNNNCDEKIVEELEKLRK